MDSAAADRTDMSPQLGHDERFRILLETMRIAIDESGAISLLSTEPMPGDGPQPLNVSDLSGFNTWLEETHPDEYRRLVRPGTPGSIIGVEIQLSYAPMNPDLVPEMTALIDEYLADG